MIGLEPQISQSEFLNVVEAIASAESVNDLFTSCDERASYKSAVYHHIPSIGAHDFNGLNRFWATGLSGQVIDYLNMKSRVRDPAMEFVFAKARPYWMSALLEEKDFADGRNLHRVNLAMEYVGDGILVPVFGPFHKRGYIFIGFHHPRDFYDEIFIWQIQAIFQAMHIRYCVLIESLRTHIKLTKRESEVVQLITFGKTNPEIGKALGISTNTVAGYVKKIFLKFDVSDRVTVALRASSFNL